MTVANAYQKSLSIVWPNAQPCSLSLSQELLKLATLLYSASRVEQEDDVDRGVTSSGIVGAGDDDNDPPLISQARTSTRAEICE